MCHVPGHRSAPSPGIILVRLLPCAEGLRQPEVLWPDGLDDLEHDDIFACLHISHLCGVGSSPGVPPKTDRARQPMPVTVRPMAVHDQARRLLIRARELSGEDSVMLRVETELMETVYVEERDGDVIVHDHGETWGWIVSHPEDEQEWDHDRVAELCAAGAAGPVTEEEDGVVVRLWLERTVQRDERLADVVSAMADLVDAIFDAHSRSGGWRG